MPKSLYYAIPCLLFMLSGCQTLEQFSIDYMVPADVSFPEGLKRVAVVNNMPKIPDNQPIMDSKSPIASNARAQKIEYFNGEALLATESLAESLANENYFDEVVICDSALRAHDTLPREATLTREETTQLVNDLEVDFLIALENVQLGTTGKIEYAPQFGAFYGSVDVKAYPVVKVYLPNRNGPMVTINSCDSIFWEEYGYSEADVIVHLPQKEEMLKQASEFAGTIPVKHLLPSWKTANRYIFAGGNVNMRDAAVYAREKQWEKAVEQWQQAYPKLKGKKKMQAAYNLAVGYEMQDDIEKAVEWALQAQAEARSIEKIDAAEATTRLQGATPYFNLTTLYLSELETRKGGLSRLNMQMQRFNNDF